jgi:hypothetical protein
MFRRQIMSDTAPTNPEVPAEVSPPVPAVPAARTPPPAPPTAGTPKPSTAFGIWALVLGIVAFVLGSIHGPSFVAFIPAILAVVFGILVLARKLAARKRGLAGLIIGGVAFIVAISVSASGTPAPASHAVSDGSSTSSNAAPAKPAPKPVKTVAPIPADVVLSGKGDSIVPLTLPDGAGEPGIATLVYSGSDNFIVSSLDSSLQEQDLMVNTIGHYSGTVLFNVESGTDATKLQVQTSGAWKITLHSIRSLREFDGASASGRGDDVLIYRGAAGAAAITNTGSGNFVIWEYGDDSNLLVNEIGKYNGTVVMGAGPALVEVNSTGNWTINVS